MEIPEHIDALGVEGERLAQAAAEAGPDAKVPTCPEWTVRDLVQHQGGVHRWAAIYVREARTEPIDDDLEVVVGGWPADADLVPWFREGYGLLIDALRGAPADLDCYTFLRAPSPLAMWARRQAHETAIHRVDAESAVGRLTPHTPALAGDGIDELLTCFAPRRSGRYRLDPARTMDVHATDTGATWSVEVGADRITTVRSASEAPDLVVRGVAPDLYLWLWNRAGTDRLSTEGDESLLAGWRESIQVRWG
jgi:uncharacterized protein (TIGR03083 family)